MASGQPDYTRQVAITVVDTPDPITVIADVTSPPLNVTFPSSQNVAVQSMPTSSGVQIKGQDAKLTTTPDLPYIAGRTATFEDSSFVTGDSPATHDVNAALSRNGHDGYIVNDGAGDLQYQISDDGTNYGGAHTLKKDETVRLTGLQVNKIKMTWVANCGYRIMVV
jgi:hypothetical protein